MTVTEHRRRRSALYTPGSNSRALEKARGIPADVVIFDLEDAVAPSSKLEARQYVCAAVSSRAYGHREVVVRINSLHSPWGVDDLISVARCGPDSLLLPKVETPQDISAVTSLLDESALPSSIRLWAMIETPRSLLAAAAIAAQAAEPLSRLDALVLGLNDLSRETQVPIRAGRAEWLPWLMHCVAAARAYSIDILDGVHNNLQADDAFALECRQARDCGMDGKTLVHPDQVSICNRSFTPEPDELAWAHQVLSAFSDPDNHGAGAVRVAGKMVERLHLEVARRLLARSAAA